MTPSVASRRSTATRDESSSEPPSVVPENGSFDSRIAATNGVHSVGKRSRRSPRCRPCLPSEAGPVIEPQQWTGRHGDGLVDVDRHRLARPQAGLGLPSPHLGGDGVAHTIVSRGGRPARRGRHRVEFARRRRRPPRPPNGMRSARAESGRHVVDHVAQHAVPRQRHDPDRQVDRFVIDRFGGMRKASWDDEAVARLEHPVDDHGAEFVE